MVKNPGKALPRITDCSHLVKQPLLDGREEKEEFLWTTFHHQLAAHQRCLKSPKMRTSSHSNSSQNPIFTKEKKRLTARRAGAGRAVDCRLRPDGKSRLRTTAALLKLCVRDSRGVRRPDGKCRHDRRLTSFGPCKRPSFSFLAEAQPRPA